jgi:hypothetical protein
LELEPPPCPIRRCGGPPASPGGGQSRVAGAVTASGADTQSKYKEKSLGGLAENFVEC